MPLAPAAGGLAGTLWRIHPFGRFLAVLFAATVAATWVVYYPLATGVPVHEDQVQWLFDRIRWTRRLPVEGVWTPS